MGERRPIGAPTRVVEGSAAEPGTVGVAYDSEGRTIVAGIDSGDVILLDPDLETWQRLACRIANRNLTNEEWNRYVGSAFRAKLHCQE